MNRILNLVVGISIAIAMFSRVDAAVINLNEGSTSGYTMTDGNTYVIKSSVSFSNATAGGSGMSVAEDATVVLFVPAGVTLTTTGANGNGTTGGGAGVRVPVTSTLIITGEGTVDAIGGNAGDGANGDNGENGVASYSTGYLVGQGGNGGNGGGGAGACIGGCGGIGGTGGVRIKSTMGTKGGDGGDAESMGILYVIGKATVTAVSGANGTPGSKGSAGTQGSYVDSSSQRYVFGGGGGGGGGGAGSQSLSPIGGGGASGGGGGSGGQGGQGVSYQWGKNNGVGGYGGGSTTKVGEDADKNAFGAGGGAGGAAGAEGDAGTLYVSPTAMVDVDREKLSATTHPAAEYTITFDVNNGRLASSAKSLTATLGCELPDCVPTPTRNCYVFDGWRTGTGEEFYGASGSKRFSSYPVASNVVLYAQWHEVAHTTTTPVSVPHSYIDESCPALLVKHGGDYEATALDVAKDGCDKVWECYVAGTSPTNSADKFSANIELRDGVPVLSWSPNKKYERDYKIWGSTNLVNGGDWEYPTNALHRFFKVTVEMP